MKSLPVSVKYIFTVYFIGILFFTVFRVILLFANAHTLLSISGWHSLLPQSLLMGLRFDTVVSGYILFLPAVIFLMMELIGRGFGYIYRIVHAFLCALFSISIFLCAADIPFYTNYGNRLNSSLLNWTTSPLFMIKMVWQSTTFLSYFFLFVLIAILFNVIMSRVYHRFEERIVIVHARPAPKSFIFKLVISLVFFGSMVLAIRGRTDEKSPIVAGTAYFCNYSLLNQAGLNPVFTFMWSWLDERKAENKSLAFTTDAEAIKLGEYYLHVNNKDGSIARRVTGYSPQHNYNIVVVLMESMSAYYMQRFGNSMALTPNLDTLAQHGYIFSDFFSAGIHTFNGIFSTIYGYPALMMRHSMDGAVIPSYSGMPCFFRQRGYETMYFTTHDDQFDNVGGFLSANNVQKITSKKDYPGERIRSTLGVSDHDLFDFSLPVINEQVDAKKPFLAIYMTGSNHDPYIVPDEIAFSPKHREVRGGCVEYADWSVGYFMKKVATMPWYDSTIFVFLGDHGSYDGPSYGDLSFAYSHIPCIIYSRMFRASPRDIHIPGGQIDVFPTLAGLLGGSYTNNTMGIDLLHEQRKWMFFSQDDKIGVADSTDVYIWQKNTGPQMYALHSKRELLKEKQVKGDSMRSYAMAMIQYSQWLRNNKLTGLSQ